MGPVESKLGPWCELSAAGLNLRYSSIIMSLFSKLASFAWDDVYLVCLAIDFIFYL